MKLKTEKIIYSALFTAIIAIVSQLSIMTPIGLPFTFQTLAVAFCGYMLSLKFGIASVLTYMAVGALGLPVFSGFQGGIHHILGPTGGFIIGFLVLVIFCSLRCKGNTFLKISLSLIGLIICHILGIIQYAFVTGNSIKISVLTISSPFIIKDAACIVAAYILSEKIKKIIKRKRS